MKSKSGRGPTPPHRTAPHRNLNRSIDRARSEILCLSTVRPSLPARRGSGREVEEPGARRPALKNVSQLPPPMDAFPNTEPGQETQGAPGIAGLAEVGQNDERYYSDLCSRQEDIPNAGVYLT